MYNLACRVFSVQPPSGELVSLLEQYATQHDIAAQALRYVAVYHWPARCLCPTVLHTLICASLSITPMAATWALYAPQVQATRELWDMLIAALAHAGAFRLLAQASKTTPKHHGVGGIYEQELFDAYKHGCTTRIEQALRLCAVHDPIPSIPPSILTTMLRQRRCVTATLAVARDTTLDLPLARELLRCPDASASTFRAALCQPALTKALRELSLAQRLRLPVVCCAAMDVDELSEQELLLLAEIYGRGAADVVRGRQHAWNTTCLQRGFRRCFVGGSMDWHTSPMATLYYVDFCSAFPQGEHARHCLLQAHRLFPKACETIGGDWPGHLLKLAMRDRRGANLACRRGAWQYLPLPKVLQDLIVEFV